MFPVLGRPCNAVGVVVAHGIEWGRPEALALFFRDRLHRGNREAPAEAVNQNDANDGFVHEVSGMVGLQGGAG